MSRIVAALIVLLVTAAPSWATDFYASPTGSGTACSAESPCTIQQWISDAAKAAGGNTLILRDGEYIGVTGMISPGTVAPGRSGSSTSPITIRAETDGQVTINGQFAVDGGVRRIPLFLNNNSYWVFDGINFKNGRMVSRITGASNNNTIRRSIFWDASLTEALDIVSVGTGGPANNLFEDIAVFGTGKNALSFGSGSGGGNLCRRCWLRWEGSTNYNTRRTMTLNYDLYIGGSCVDCIATWSAEQQPKTYDMTQSNGQGYSGSGCTTTGEPAPPTGDCHRTGHDTFVDGDNAIFAWGNNVSSTCLNTYVRGGIAYIKSSTLGNQLPHYMYRNIYMSCVEWNHDIAFLHPNHPGFNGGTPQNMLTFKGGTVAGQNTVTATRITSVNGVGSYSIAVPPYVVTSHVSVGTEDNLAATLAALDSAGANPYTGTAGAQRCYQYGTTTPLWPWPMNGRIRAATAAAGAYTGPTCVNCTYADDTTNPPSRSETDVQAEVVALLGAIPAQCTEEQAPPPFPTVTDFPTNQTPLDTFDRSDGSLGANWTTDGTPLSISANVALGPSGVVGNSYWTSPFAAEQEAYATLSALPDVGRYVNINFAHADTINRSGVTFINVTGAANDTVTLFRYVEGVYSEPIAAVNLGWDLAVGDRLGVRVKSGNVADVIYCRVSTSECYRVGQVVLPSLPASGTIGVSARSPASLNDFGGGLSEAQGGGSTPPPYPSRRRRRFTDWEAFLLYQAP